MKKIITGILEKLQRIYAEDFGYLLLITVFNYVGFAWARYIFGKYAQTPLYLKSLKIAFGFINMFAFFTLILLLISFLGKKVKNIVLKIYFGISLLMFIVDVFLLVKFHLIINSTTVQILAETNRNESIEFLKSNLGIVPIISIVVLLFLCWIISKVKIDIKKKPVLIILFIYALVQGVSFKSNTRGIPVFRLKDGIVTSIENAKIYKRLQEKINNDVVITKNSSKIKNIVFIIGESTTRNHMGLYGYSLDTNPLLEKLEEKGNLFKFTDVISSHGQTIPSMKKMLTFYNGESEKEWYEYNNVIDIMKKAGYRTYWFSNQESSGIFGNLPAAYGHRSDVVLFNLNRDSEQEVYDAYDGEIVEKSVKEVSGDKNFVIYHLLGTHKGYSYRYPQEFSIFKSEDIKRDNLDDEQRKTISEYDNAVLYNDYVVKSIIDIYKDSDSIVIYLSDHGEEVYDFRDVADHGEGNISHYMVEIPFIIYVSDKFKENYPELVEKIKNSTSRPYMTDDIIHTILDISGVETKDYDPTRSVIDDKFIQRDRLIHDKSYDNYWKTLN